MTATLWQQWLLVCGGAVLGASLRWLLGLAFHAAAPSWAWGMLAANWLGCLLAGAALATDWPTGAKAWWIVGFLGSLTTFSAFSAQVLDNWLAGREMQALLLFCLHNFGGLACAALGFAVFAKNSFT